MSEKIAIRKLVNAGFSNEDIVEMLSVKWYNLFKSTKKIIGAGVTREEMNKLFSLQKGSPDKLKDIIRTIRREKEKQDLLALLSREKESYSGASSPVRAPEHSSFKPSDLFGRNRW